MKDILMIILLITAIGLLISTGIGIIFVTIENHKIDKMLMEAANRIQEKEKETTSEKEEALDPSSFDDDFDDVDIDFKTD